MEQNQKEMTNKELESVLPDVRNILHKMMDSGSFSDYENTLDDVTNKAIGELKRIIENQTLALDPEQMVAAVKVLTKAKIDIIESKRKLLDTCIKGEVMIKALEQPKDNKNENSVLLEYLERAGLNPTVDKTGTNPGTAASIFESIQNEE